MSARYSRQAGYTIAKRQPTRAGVRTVQRRLRFGPTTAKFLGLAVLAILAFLLIGNTGSGATVAYERNTLQKEISQQDQQLKSLEVEKQRLETINEIQKNADLVQQLVTPGVVEQVETGDVAGVSTSHP